MDGPATKQDIFELKNANAELLEAIHLFAASVDKRFDEVDKRFQEVDNRFESSDKQFLSINKQFESIDKQFHQIRSTMVTKDYLDDKLADLRGDITLLMRKEDTKVKMLVGVLLDKGVIEESDKKKIYSMEPFAQS